jgi:hypothetical protein
LLILFSEDKRKLQANLKSLGVGVRMRITFCAVLLGAILLTRPCAAETAPKIFADAPVVELSANWGRNVMPTLADKKSADGTVYMELPLIRIYNAQGQRLRLPDNVTSPRYTAAGLNSAIATMEIDATASDLSADLALLETATGESFADTSELPPAEFYVVDYSAEWCRTSKPFEAALENWHRSARNVVLIRAHANFGTSKSTDGPTEVAER